MNVKLIFKSTWLEQPGLGQQRLVWKCRTTLETFSVTGCKVCWRKLNYLTEWSVMHLLNPSAQNKRRVSKQLENLNSQRKTFRPIYWKAVQSFEGKLFNKINRTFVASERLIQTVFNMGWGSMWNEWKGFLNDIEKES